MAYTAGKFGYETLGHIYTLDPFFIRIRRIWLSLRMFLMQTIHFPKFLGKSQAQYSYKNGSYTTKGV